MRMRFRTDHRFIAEAKALGVNRWSFVTQEEWDAVPAAEPGDVWRCCFVDGLLAGYDIACPTCRHLHAWTSSRNCPSRRERGELGIMCDHKVARRSCWEWTGVAELGTLTASPSLWSVAEYGGCGFHGFLVNGELSG